MPSPIPTGTVTFLFTDIEGSTKLWESGPEAMAPAVARHESILRGAFERSGGSVFKTVGDAFCAVFATAAAALAAALAAQQALAAEPWDTRTPLRVRMALHTGTAEERGGDYFGPSLSRVSRLLAAGHGGQTLLSGASHELVRDSLPPPAALLDLGLHRLKDVARPERVYQLVHPSLPAAFPPLRSLDSPDMPNNLPPQTTSFIGREREVAEVRALLDRSRLLTLTGAGGAGKTRISLQAAADSLDRYADGVWFVELAPLADPALVAQAVAQVLGVREAAETSPSAALAEWLGPKRLLLVLDNCEHLLQACAALASALLRRCPHVRLLASSREPLAVPGEQTYRVPSLSLPDPKRPVTVATLSQCESVRLFVERARLVQPTFTVTEDTAASLARVCVRLDGIPLAIELAAARVRSLPVEQIGDRLSDRFRFLTGGSRAALPRQQTLRALIDWSYDLLTEAERGFLRRLSVFAGGWTLAAAEAVCAGPGLEGWEVLDGLTSLVDKSLVIYDLQVPARYRLQETVRQYAKERLAEGENDGSAGERHRDFYLAFAEEACPKLLGAEQGALLAQLEGEHDNLRAALSRSADGPGAADKCARLAVALGRFWEQRGHWSEGRAYLWEALAREGVEDLTRAWALRWQGLFAARQGDHAESDACFAEAAATFRAFGDAKGEATVLIHLGTAAQQRGEWAAARAAFVRVLETSRALEDRGAEATMLLGLGAVAHLEGDYDGARSRHREALAISLALGNRRAEGACLANLGLAAQGQGAYAEAQELLQEALAISRALGDPYNEAANLHNLGDLALYRGDHGRARSCVEQALAINRAAGNRLWEVNNLHCLGNVAFDLGDTALARSHYQRALEVNGALDNPRGDGYLLWGLGRAATCEGRHAEARTALARALGIFTRLQLRAETAACVEAFASLAAAQDNHRAAACLFGATEALRGPVGALSPPSEQERYEADVSRVRAAMGGEAFPAAWAVGQSMALEEAVEHALRPDSE